MTYLDDVRPVLLLAPDGKTAILRPPRIDQSVVELLARPYLQRVASDPTAANSAIACRPDTHAPGHGPECGITRTGLLPVLHDRAAAVDAVMHPDRSYTSVSGAAAVHVGVLCCSLPAPWSFRVPTRWATPQQSPAKIWYRSASAQFAGTAL